MSLLKLPPRSYSQVQTVSATKVGVAASRNPGTPMADGRSNREGSAGTSVGVGVGVAGHGTEQGREKQSGRLLRDFHQLPSALLKNSDFLKNQNSFLNSQNFLKRPSELCQPDTAWNHLSAMPRSDWPVCVVRGLSCYRSAPPMWGALS